jgi:hypothetical protein
MDHTLNTELTGPDSMNFIGAVLAVHGVAQAICFLAAVIEQRGLEGDADREASKDLAQTLLEAAQSDAAYALDCE